MRLIRYLSTVSLLAVLLCSYLAAQTAGKLIGQVSDPSSASVPDAKVSAVNTATGQVRAINTDASGSYAISDSTLR